MESKKLIREPGTLSFVTTYRCSAACDNCCFQCSPKRREELSFEDISYCLRQARRDFPSIKVVVLTGGECTLLNCLTELIGLINREFGYAVRIVTNAHWALTPERAREKVLEWKEAGLNEINISTGDEHLRYVPVDRVMNAAIVSAQEGFIPYVNIEAAENHSYNFRSFVSDDRIRELMEQGRLLATNGMWIDFKHGGNEGDGNKLGCCVEESCSNLFSSISITPDRRMKACCGITSNYIKYLDLGDPFKHPIRELYDRQFSDFMKIWITAVGPHKVMDFISGHGGAPAPYSHRHPCEVCAMILNDPQRMDIARSCYREIYTDIILRHLINA